MEFSLCLAIAVIAGLACIPIAKTYAGQNVFQKAGAIINEKSAIFFLVILLLTLMALICFVIRWYLAKYEHISDIESFSEIQRNGITRIQDQLKQFDFEIHQTEQLLYSERPENLRIVEKQKASVTLAFIEIESVYKDNLRGYYDTNLKIYAIVKKTQLIRISEIKDLIDHYGKLT